MSKVWKGLLVAVMLAFCLQAGQVKAAEQENIALNKTATASSDSDQWNNNKKAANAVDGNMNTAWGVADGSFPHWLKIDLGYEYKVSGVRQVFGTDADNQTHKYKIEGSLTGSDEDNGWTTIADHTTEGVTTKDRTDTLDAPQVYRYIRLTVTEIGGGNWASSKELEIYGTREITEAQIKADWDDLKIGYGYIQDTENSITGSVSLPAIGKNTGLPITWKTNNAAVITDKGVVNRPVADTVVTLTASMEVNGETKTKDYQLTVKAKQNATEVSKVAKNGSKGYLEVDGKPYTILGIQSFGEWQTFHDGTNPCVQIQDPEKRILPQDWLENTFEKVKMAGFKTIQIELGWRAIEPKTEGVYDWTLIDKYIAWANKYDLKIDFVWFGSNGCGGGILQNSNHGFMASVPEYLNDKDKYWGAGNRGNEQECPWLPIPGSVHYEDADYMFRCERSAVHAMFNHLAQIDTNHRVIQFQLNNEPDYHSQWSSQFNIWLSLLDRLGEAVKNSDYVVATRVNLTGWTIGDRGKQLANQPNIDFVGPDRYDWNVSGIADGVKEGAKNSPIAYIPETYSNNSNITSIAASALVSGGFIDFWQLNDSWAGGNYAFYGDHKIDGKPNYLKWELGKAPETIPQGVTDMTHFNTGLNKMFELVATALPKDMAAFNIEKNTPETNYNVSKTLGGCAVHYICSDGSIGMAVYNESDNSIYCITDSSTSAEYSFAQKVTVEVGSIDETGNWVKTEDRTANESGNVTINADECLKVTVQPRNYSVENLNEANGTVLDYAFDGRIEGETTPSAEFTVPNNDFSKQESSITYDFGKQIFLSGIDFWTNYGSGQGVTKFKVSTWQNDAWEPMNNGEEFSLTWNGDDLQKQGASFAQTETSKVKIILTDANRKWSNKFSIREIEFAAEEIVPERTLEEITVTPPIKTEYEYGEELDLTGLKVVAVYSDRTEEDVTGEISVDGYHANIAGEQKIRVTYKDRAREFAVTVKEKTEVPVEKVLERIEVTAPAKVEYEYGEELDLTGLAIIAIYSDGTQEIVTGAERIDGYDANVSGEQKITVAYKDKTGGFVVTVKEQPEVPVEKILERIEVTAPAKVEYEYGEELDLTGLIVTAIYSDGTKGDVTGMAQINGYDANRPGDQQVTILYKDKAGEFIVTVKEKENIGNIEQITRPENNALSGILPNQEEFKHILTEEDQAAVANGESVKIELKVDDITDNVPAADKKLTANVLNGELNNQYVEGMYLDLSLLKTIGEKETEKIAETAGAITIRFTLPENLRNANEGISRIYKIIRIHDKESAILDTVLDVDGITLTFQTDRFSTYALVYNDVRTGGNPGEDDKKPGEDDKKPGENDKKPGEDDEKPDENNKKPVDNNAQNSGNNNNHNSISSNDSNNDNTNTNQTAGNRTSSPRTGDTQNIMLFVVMMILALVVIGSTTSLRRKIR